MTLREKLANWLTGGQYADAKIQPHRLEHHFGPMLVRYENALFDIEAMETASANATVKRMAKAAREALVR